MGIDQLVTGGDVDDPVVESLGTDRTQSKVRTTDFSDRWPQFPRQRGEWEMPLNIGPDPTISHPLIDGSAFGYEGAADPFALVRPGDDVIHVFAEVLDSPNQLAHWTTPNLRSGFTADSVISGFGSSNSLSWPYAFHWDGESYMMPDGESGDKVVFGTADDDTLNSWTVQNRPITDSTGTVNDALAVWVPTSWPSGRWWVFYSDDNNDFRGWYGPESDYSDASAPETVNYTEADWSPETGGINRPRGRPMVYQDGTMDIFGEPNVTSFRVSELSPSAITWTQNGMDQDMMHGLASDTDGKYWNDNNMHHMDPLLARYSGGGVLVDGNDGTDNKSYSVTVWRIGETWPLRYVLEKSSAQTISGDSSWNKINFTTDVYNPGADWDGNDFIARVSGYYDFEATVMWGTGVAAGDELRVRFGDRTNGGLLREGGRNRVADADTGRQSMSVSLQDVYLTEGQQVSVDAWQNSGSGTDIEGFGGELSIRRTGPN